MTELRHGDLGELPGDAELVLTAGHLRAVLRAAQIDQRFLRLLRARVVGERERVITGGGRRCGRWPGPGWTSTGCRWRYMPPWSRRRPTAGRSGRQPPGR